MLVRQRGLHLVAEQEVEQRPAALGVVGAGEDAGVLDLRKQVSSRALVVDSSAPFGTVNAGEES